MTSKVAVDWWRTRVVPRASVRSSGTPVSGRFGTHAFGLTRRKDLPTRNHRDDDCGNPPVDTRAGEGRHIVAVVVADPANTDRRVAIVNYDTADHSPRIGSDRIPPGDSFGMFRDEDHTYRLGAAAAVVLEIV